MQYNNIIINVCNKLGQLLYNIIIDEGGSSSVHNIVVRIVVPIIALMLITVVLVGALGVLVFWYYKRSKGIS